MGNITYYFKYQIYLIKRFSKVFNFTSIGNVTDSNKKTYTFCNTFESFQYNSNSSTQKQDLSESLKFTTCTMGIKAVFVIYFP